MSIIIKKPPAIDEEATDEMFKEFAFSANYMHIKDVQKGCAFIANKIIEAGINHDDTKMTVADIDILIEERNAGVSFKDSKWHKSHISNNRHHYHQLENCPDDFNLIDVIESLVDCTMAIKARRGQAFKMPPDFISPELLAKAFKNTLEMLENEIIVENN